MREAVDREQLRDVYDRTAKRYDKQHAAFTMRADERGRRLVVRHGVRIGDAVLDAGGGTGSTSLLAADRVGQEGSVIVFDMSGGMLSVAKGKAERESLPGRMRFVVGDILRLPFRDGAFDAVLSTYSVCPLYDPAAGALELYRVVCPGGRLAVAHSAEPRNGAVRWLADRLEDVAWRFPMITLGCRPVTILPALLEAGAQVTFERRLGVPLYPFLVFVVEKPER